MNKTILIIEAHIDDAIFGCPITILSNLNNNNKVIIYSVCQGRCDNKNISQRKTSIKKLKDYINKIFCNPYNFDYIHNNYYDLEITNDNEKMLNIEEDIKSKIAVYNPDIVIFPEGDLHDDHVLINRICKKILRPFPTNKVKQTYTYGINGSYDWLGDLQLKNCKVSHLSDLYLKELKFIINIFDYELQKNNNDLRSVDALINKFKYVGNVFGKSLGNLLYLHYDISEDF